MKTIEEKAKAYDESFERAKVAHKDTDRHIKAIIERIFPDLKESEDERIRKCIGMALTDVAEQRFTDFGTSLKECLAYLEKQKEQKPNFSEKDSTDFEIEVHEIIAQARSDSRLNDADVLKQFEEEAAFALMLRANKLIEQKPAWSEEDEEIFNNIIEKAKGGHWIEVNEITWLINRFKSLRPSWKPSEEQIAELKALANGKAVFTKDFIVKLYNDLLKLK